MTIWSEPSSEVLDIARELIDQFHPDLKEAKIGFVLRDEAPVSNGKQTCGKASKISDKLRSHLDLDFLIWIAEDVYTKFTPEQRRALIDHELYHCNYTDGIPKMLHHDVEEFLPIVERYGLWNYDLLRGRGVLEKAVQESLPFVTERGAVISVDPEQMRIDIQLQE
jgi:hypothetical protein